MNIILESDSKVVLDLIMSDVQPHHPHTPLISQIVQLQHRDWIVNFQDTLRQGKECANWLAKYGASSLDALKSWSFCSLEIVVLVLFLLFLLDKIIAIKMYPTVVNYSSTFLVVVNYR